MLRFLVFQHMPWEKPGSTLLKAAKRHKARLNVVEVWREPIPDIDPYDGLIVLGGSPNVDQEAQYPFLRAEKKAIRRAIDLNKGYLGFCLGHQLLGDALGAHVGPNFCTSIGFVEGRLTKEGREHPIFGNMPLSLPLCKWHTQAVLPPMPKDVDVLVTSKVCEVEAMSVEGRPHLVGLQFDNHVNAADLADWVAGDNEFLDSKDINTDALLNRARELEGQIACKFEVLFDNYIKMIS